MLDDASLLLAWERGYGRPPFEQALALLETVWPDNRLGELMNLSIGQRDAALLDMRRQLFGQHMDTLTNCPECDQVLELSFGVDDIMLAEVSKRETHRVELADYHVEYRLPTCRDLAALTQAEPEKRADQLLLQCVSHVQQGEQRVQVTSLPLMTRQRITQAIADSDPQADVQLDMNCAGCGHRWNSSFDIVGFLWAELNAWCQRLLAEIHALAKAYGWSEWEILALSRWRRQVYLGMIRQ